MKKVVLISDGRELSKNTFNFLYNLHEQEAFLLTGAFFHCINSRLLIGSAFAPGTDALPTFTNKENDAYLAVMETFKTLCTKSNIEYRIHQQNEIWDVDDIVKESRYADLMVLNGESFFNDLENEQPNSFLRDVLKNAECATIVIPEDVRAIKRIAVAYDGKKESVFALKRFCDLLPYLKHLPVDIYYWADKTDHQLADLDYLKEYAGRHFPNVNFRELFFDASKYLSNWMSENKDTMLICGSYHRSTIFSGFRKSFSDDVIKNHSAPVFIAHS